MFSASATEDHIVTRRHAVVFPGKGLGVWVPGIKRLIDGVLLDAATAQEAI